MTGEARRSALKQRVVAGALLLGGAVLFWAGASFIISLMRLIDGRAPVVAVASLAGAGVPLGVGLVIAGLLMWVPNPPGGQRPSETAMRRAGAGLVAIVICLLVAAFTPTLTTSAVDSALQRRGYSRCPVVFWEKPVKQRWALPMRGEPFGHCPASGDEAGRVDPS